MAERGRERDLVLTPNEFAFISDETKGNINVYVGPHKTSLANTDQPVVFNPKNKRFDRCSLEAATQTLSIAPEGWYLVLKNPARDQSHPRTGSLNNLPELNVGRKIAIPGPISFALWPGQMVRTVQGHHIRSNQYLVVRVYDEEAAKANWKNAVIKLQLPAATDPAAAPVAPTAPETVLRPDQLPDLTMGKQLVIRGLDVSFYIPPTGVEVVADEGDEYVREAITLERLEYCILLDENGNKRYIQGPSVVFPKPTETFVGRLGSRKFKAIELNETSGIYLKVIAPYEEDGKSYKVGEEIFLTGKDQMIYFPRPEHAIIRYGDQEIHYGVAIPPGEARYVLNRQSGQISLKRGPAIFLPDPRNEVIVRRVLTTKQVQLWFPGNVEALEYNKSLAALSSGENARPAEFVADKEVKKSGARLAQQAEKAEVPTGFAGDELNRQTKYTPPRTITLDTRYEGVVFVDVWSGYAVQVVSKTGNRKVVVGPQSHLLEYDETLQPMELSTGTPKTEGNLLKTVYMRVLHNKVSDLVQAETRDLVRVHMHLSYRVNFEGEPARWFEVENYVKFLTDHMRSMIRAAVKQQGIEGFYANSAQIIRDVVLGAPGEGGKRPGRPFENGMRVYDVEVLDVNISDAGIAELLQGAQHAAVEQTLRLAADVRHLEATKQGEQVKQQIDELTHTTKLQALALKAKETLQAKATSLTEIAAEAETRAARQSAQLSDQGSLESIHQAELARKRATLDLDTEHAQRQLELRLRQTLAEVTATQEKAKAISPDLIAALQAFGDRALVEKMAESMGPLAILGGESVSDVLGRLLQGTALSKLVGRGDTSAPALPPAKK
jgi:major vault protein